MKVKKIFKTLIGVVVISVIASELFRKAEDNKKVSKEEKVTEK